jgi:hypothetical protein
MSDENGSAISRSGAPPLVIATPFGIGVKDPAWFEHRMVLTSSITIPSLLAQYDQDFYWILFVDSNLPPAIRSALEEALAPFEGRAFMSERRYKPVSALALAQERGATGSGEYVLTGRIDDDDAWSREMVGVARQRAMSWIQHPSNDFGLGFTFEYGFEWIMYEMIDIDALQKKGRDLTHQATVRPYTVSFLGTSVFVLSKLSSGITAISAGHTNMPKILKREKLHVDVISTEQPMWLYCRHKQAGSGLRKARGSAVEVTLADLAREFGLDEAKTSHYLASADTYGYSLAKRIKGQRPRVEKELGIVNRKLDDPRISNSQKVQLREERIKLAEEVARMSENLIGDPREMLTRNQS